MIPSSPSPRYYTTPRHCVRFMVVSCLLGVVLAACAGDPAQPPPVIGGPLPGLTAVERDRFEEGRRLFSTLFTSAEGLGPRFNGDACNACHTDPADGGTGEQLVIRASRWLDTGRCDPLSDQGGENLRREVTAALAAAGGGAVPIPGEATHVGRFTTPFLFGLGLVDAVPIEALEAGADPDDLDGNGISGRLGRDGAGRAGRFGRKASVADLRTFVDEAFRFEMGLTTPPHPSEGNAGAVPPVPEGADEAGDPEMDAEAVALVLDFVRLLAPPPRAVVASEDEASVGRGEGLFRTLGCVSCHTASLRTGGSPMGVLANRSIALFSDLLLHDMGPELIGSCTLEASPTEYRTEPLMGLRWRRSFLHDGRAQRVIDAVLMHGGEAQAARDAFAKLDRLTQEDLLRFLATL